MSTDLYEILGVPRDASQDDIKTAYRKLARELHPDVNASPHAEERFKQIAGAYEILSDPDKRARYDTFGQASGAAGFPFTDIQDIFDMFFGSGGFGVGTRRGRGGIRTGPQRGEDVFVAVVLSFREAAFGSHHDIEVERLVTCDRCLGVGAEPGTAPMACRTCGGAGEVQEMRRSMFGTLVTATTCRTCAGSGQEILDRCEACFGEGRRKAAGSVPVDIPAGVADGLELRVSGAGHGGRRGGPAGDLYVGIHVEPSLAFDRRGQDLFSVLDVPATMAALGGEVEVDTLDGLERLRIDPGTDSGATIRLRGKGVPNLNRRGRGDLFITVHVATPTELSKDERRLLEQFADLRRERSSKKEPSRRELRRPDA